MRIRGRPTRQKLDALAGIGLLALAGFFGYSAFRPDIKPAAVARERAEPSTTTTTRITTTTTTTPTPLGMHDFKRGDCVDWDESSAVKDTSIVSCDEPHWAELAAAVDVPAALGAPYPDVATWDQLTAAHCTAPVNEYQELDPYGRFGLGTILTGAVEWNRGDRQIWCGIEAQADRITNVAERTTGRVKGQDQARPYPPGTCLLSAYGLVDDIACTEPHHYETVGERTLAARFDELPTAEEWTAIRNDCVSVAERYLGRALASIPGLTVASGELSARQWDAGTRRIECQVVRVDAAGVPQPVVGSFRDAA